MAAHLESTGSIKELKNDPTWLESEEAKRMIERTAIMNLKSKGGITIGEWVEAEYGDYKQSFQYNANEAKEADEEKKADKERSEEESKKSKKAKRKRDGSASSLDSGRLWAKDKEEKKKSASDATKKSRHQEKMPKIDKKVKELKKKRRSRGMRSSSSGSTSSLSSMSREDCSKKSAATGFKHGNNTVELFQIADVSTLMKRPKKTGV